MDSGNSGSISSSGDEEYDSRADHTLLPSTNFLSHHPNTHFGSSHHHHQTQQHHSLFDLSSSYLHSLSQSQPNSFLNLDTAAATSPNCTDLPTNLPGVSSSSTPSSAMNQCLFPPLTDPSLQLRPLLHDDNNARVLSSAPTTTNNAARNSKKRTRASRRAPTTVLTTDTSNFRAMVQEFTGIPAPPFSASSSFSRSTRRLDLLTGSSSSSFRSSSSQLDPTASFYPLRPSPQKLHHHPNPFVLSNSPSSPSPSTLHNNNNNNNMVDAIASTTNNNKYSINYQLTQSDHLGLPYHHQQQNMIMLSMQNHPAPPVLAGFGARSPPSLEDLGMSHGQVVNNADLGATGVSMHHQGHVQQVTSLEWGYGCKVVASGDGGGSCKMNFSSSASAASNSLNHEKTLDNISTTRGEGGTVDSWICSSD